MLKWVLKSFRRQIVLLLLVLSLSISIAVLFKYYYNEKEQFKNILDVQVSQLIHSFSLSTKSDVLYNNYFELSDNIIDLYEYSQKKNLLEGSIYTLKEVCVVDKAGYVLGHSNPQAHPLKTLYKHPLLKLNTMREMDKVNMLWNREQTNLSVGAPIYYDAELVGFLFMEVDTTYLSEKEKALMQGILIVFMVLVPLILVVSIFFTIWLQRPLVEILKELDILGEGKIEFKFLEKRYDEFFILGKAIKKADRRLAEQKKDLIKDQKVLETMVEERTLEVQQKADELENTLEELRQSQEQLIQSEKMSALGSLVAGVAHEINTPVGTSLTGITYIESETKKLITSVEEEKMSKSMLMEYLEMVFKMSASLHLSLQKAAELVRSFKQVAVDQNTEEKRTFILNSYFDDVILSLHSSLRDKDVEVVNNIDKEIRLNSYPGSFSQVLTNFIMNSLLHAFDKNTKGKITLNGWIKDDTLNLTYEDNGKGMDEEDLKKIFDPFFTTKLGNGGSGLGLNITYNLITHKLNGDISCESKPEEGMKMIISIPMDEVKA